MNSNLKAAIILIVVFAIGAMAGVVYTHRMEDRPRGRDPRIDPFRSDPTVVGHIERRIVEKYDLTEEQAVAVRKILMDAQKKYDDFFDETRPTFDQIRRAQQDAIRAIMTPEQVEAFDKWLEERRKRREQYEAESRENGGRPRPHNGRPPQKNNSE